MTQANITKATPLYPWHRANGATMGEFAGYSMPLWYDSAKNEHLAVLTTSGLFDTSHMSFVMVAGNNARELLQFCFSRDLDLCLSGGSRALKTGRCVYGVFLNHEGHVFDDAVVCQMADDRYLVVVNAGMGMEISGHLRSQQKTGQQARVMDITVDTGKVDLQGPLAAKIVWKILKQPGTDLADFPYFAFKGSFDPDISGSSGVFLKDGTPVMLSRSGYTGEFGFEIFIARQSLKDLWLRLLEAGKDLGIKPCGLAARDSLRAGAGLPLAHQDIGNWIFLNNPWSFALPFNRDKPGFTKNFIGAHALLSARDPGYTYPFAGYDARKVSAGEALVMDGQDNEMGKVLTCVTDMGIDWDKGRIFRIGVGQGAGTPRPRGLCCGFLWLRSKVETGSEIVLRDKRRDIKACIVEQIRPGLTARRSLKEML
ncbi:MAG: aminomethyltransferase family protein [Desulfobia sp.]